MPKVKRVKEVPTEATRKSMRLLLHPPPPKPAPKVKKAAPKKAAKGKKANPPENGDAKAEAPNVEAAAEAK